jgi:hypothetical protein
MKIVFIFGKGIDGCGVTRGALLFEKWLNDAGHSTSVINFNNKQVMLRAKNVKFIGPIVSVHHSEFEVSNKVVDLVNQADIAIFHSYPTKKQFHYVERFRRFLERVDGPLVVMHDHGVSQQTINLVPQAGEIFSYADVLVPQSLDGISSVAFTKFDPGLVGRVVENPIWLEPKSLSGFCQDFSSRRKELVYVGRMSIVKDPSMLCRIEPFFPPGWKFSLIGCEKSLSMFRPASKAKVDMRPSPYISEYRDRLMYFNLNKGGGYSLSNWGVDSEDKARIFIYDNYRYEWGMEQLGGSMASWCGYKLRNSSNYGHRMEYTTIESFLLSLPIINRHFAENALSPEGRLWKTYYGPLISQVGEEEKLAEELVRISENKSEWDSRTAACRELVYKFNNISVLAPKFFNKILSLGKRKLKPDPLCVIETWFPQAKEYRAQGEILMSNPTSIMGEIPMVLEGNKQKKVVVG